MKASQKLQLEQSKKRQKINELLAKDELTAEERAELETATERMGEIEVELRGAITAEADDEAEARNNGGAGELDAETRERLELRGRCNVGAFVAASLRGRAVTGAEAELQEAAGIPEGIPLELWDRPRQRVAERGAEDRVVTASPDTVGVNLDVLQPQVFAPSIAARLMIDMPRVMSGSYATATVTAGANPADAVAKGDEVPEVESTWTAATTTPHRIGAALRLTLEDIAAVGQSNFEEMLRQHISVILSDELDDQVINGDGANDDLTGIFQRLANPANPAAAVETWTRFLAIQSSTIDGLWATELEHIAMLVNPETYRLAAATFQGADSEESAASYLKRMGADFWTNKRMPAKAAHIAQGIICRKGRSMMPTPMRTAVCPHWGYVSIDDIYSGAGKGERRFVLSALVGDVILTQPDAYAQVAFRVSI